jgi:UDP:flavonoid glycosyltransferase YjiC (YdhE family)
MRVLFATTANTGHFWPLVPFAQACRRAGHDVLVAGDGHAAPDVRRAGLPFQALPTPDVDEVARFQAGQAGLSPVQAMARALTELYVRLYAGAALPDMLAAIEEWRPDVVVRESAEFSSLIAAERLGVAQARVGIGLSARLERDMLSLGGSALDELGATVGAGPGLGERAAGSLSLTMAPASFDTPASDGPGAIRRYRDVPAHAAGPPPDGWGDPGAPLVYLSFGTEVPSPQRPYFPRLYRTAVEALEGTGARVLVTIGAQRDPAELGPVPPSVRVERWVAQADVMPHAAAMVGHGGSGSTLSALSAGVPMALVPLFADQFHNANRVAELGAGIALDGDSERLAGLERAVLDLLSVSRYRDRARGMADEIHALPPVDEAPDALAALAAGDLRPEASPAVSAAPAG